MAERRKNKKKKEIDIKLDDKPSKEEYAVAKYLKQTLPEKKTTLLGHKVEYFIASKAVDCLVDSQWAKDNKKGELNFSNRDIVVDFMAKLLDHKFFHRARKIVVQKESKKKKKESEEAAQDSGKEKESKKSEKSIKTDDKIEEVKKDGEVVEKKKEKKKIKLDMHLEQIFIDSNEPYVWIYDPIPLKTWITGTLMVIAAVLLCLFPLWPQTIRHYIYYLSVAAAFFLVFIIGLAVLRLVVFVLVWVVTFGKHHLWLLPNLTEDVGFFESFWPLYHYEYKGCKDKKDSKSDSKDKEEPKSKDKEDSPKEEKETDKKAKEIEKEEEEESQGSEEREDGNRDQSQSESEKSESEEHKTDNGFEFLEADEVSESPGEEEEVEDRKTK